MPDQDPNREESRLMILGLVSLFVCQLLGPYAWYRSRRYRIHRKIIQEPIGKSATIGHITAILATIFIVLNLLFFWLAYSSFRDSMQNTKRQMREKHPEIVWDWDGGPEHSTPRPRLKRN